MSSLAPRAFAAPIATAGPRAHVPLPFDPDAVWGAKARHHVAGTVGGCAIRGELERVEGRGAAGSDVDGDDARSSGVARPAYVLSLGPAWLRDAPAAVRAALAAGDAVDVVLAPEGPLGERLAPDLRAAFEAAPEARAFFESLPTFYRNNFVRWIEAAKRPATRAERIATTVRRTGEGQRE